MMDTSTKYRRWGWGAVIGLIAVILLAGLVVALSMGKKSKLADANMNADTNSGNVAVEDNNGSSTKSDEKVAEGGASENSNTQKEAQSEEKNKTDNEKQTTGSTGVNASDGKNVAGAGTTDDDQSVKQNVGATSGSKEMPKTGPIDATIAIIGLAVSAYLLSLNVAMAREEARK